MQRCDVFGVTYDGELTNQCDNMTDELWEFDDMIDDVNLQFVNQGLRMTGPAICEMHMNMVEDI